MPCCVKVWTENKQKDGATNFITGVGGFLQALLFGYGGVRLRETSLDFDPILPPGCSEMRFMGIDYMNSSLSLTVVDRNMTVMLTSAGRFPLRLLIESRSIDLVLNQPVIVDRTKARIAVIKRSSYVYRFLRTFETRRAQMYEHLEQFYSVSAGADRQVL